MQKVLLTIALVSLTALAGCSDAPPSGAFTANQSGFSLNQASVTLDVTPAENPYNGSVPEPLGSVIACNPDAITGNDPSGNLPACQDAHSDITVNAQSMPLPAASYELVLVGANELTIGTLEQMEGMDHYTLDIVVDGDLSGYDHFELRDNGIVVGTAPGSGGSFEVAAALQGIVVDCTYKGKDLTCTTTGGADLPLRAWLLALDEETQQIEHVEPFDLVPDGEKTHFSAENIADFAEFHVHIGDSSINVAKVVIQ